MRDLETEGAMYADVDVKTAINRGVIPGPRMFVATRSLAPTGMYNPTRFSWELRICPPARNSSMASTKSAKPSASRSNTAPTGSNITPMAARNSATAASTPGSISPTRKPKPWCDEAHRLGHKVAAHAGGREAIESALRGGRRYHRARQRHGRPLIGPADRQGRIWCPTHLHLQPRRPQRERRADAIPRERISAAAVAEGRQDRLRHRHRRLRLDGEPGRRISTTWSSAA